MRVKIEPVGYEATLELRQRVLWPNKPIEFCLVEGDENATHFGAYLKDELVGVASVYEHLGSARLRKFAVDEKYQNMGVGSDILAHIVKSCKSSELSTLWCDARESATHFYERFGMCIEGEKFYKAEIPYFKMTLTL